MSERTVKTDNSIDINDLPPEETLTPEEKERLAGAGRRSYRPMFEVLEAREMMDAGFALQTMLIQSPGVYGHQAAQVRPAAANYGVQGSAQVANLAGMSCIDALKAGSNWINYEPKTTASGQHVDQSQIRSELTMLYNKGIRGLVTYSFDNGREEIPRIAKEIGFQQVIAGVWATTDYATEKANLMSGNRLQYIDGLVVGNETQLRYVNNGGDTIDFKTLETRFNEIKGLTNKRTTTSDAWNLYLPGALNAQGPSANLMRLGDWVFPNMHPYFEAGDQSGWHPHQNPVDGVTFVKAVLRDHFDGKTAGRMVALHETWWPSAADGTVNNPSYVGSATEANQQLYFNTLSQTKVVFVYGEAFDQVWKKNEGTGDQIWNQGHFGAHWGLWQDANPTSAKQAVGTLYLGDRSQ